MSVVSGWVAWLCVAIGGGLGALARVGLVSGVVSILGAKYSAWGVTLVNLLGALAFALVLGLSARSISLELPLKALLLSGFIGAFTTFSTFTFEAWQMLHQGAWFHCGVYMMVNMVGSLAAFFLGVWLMGHSVA